MCMIIPYPKSIVEFISEIPIFQYVNLNLYLIYSFVQFPLNDKNLSNFMREAIQILF